MELPKYFTECPICHTKETICRIGCDQEKAHKDTFVSLGRDFTPIQDVSRLVGPTAKGILVHYDVCAGCGMRYATKAEIVNAPVTMNIPGTPPPGKGG